MCIEDSAPFFFDVAAVMDREQWWIVSKNQDGHANAHRSLLLKIDTPNCEMLLFRILPFKFIYFKGQCWGTVWHVGLNIKMSRQPFCCVPRV
jgi:hypothetical protein